MPGLEEGDDRLDLDVTAAAQIWSTAPETNLGRVVGCYSLQMSVRDGIMHNF